jgi:predicted XRE-type DNA-binding protein
MKELIEQSSGNLYEDLGRKNAEKLQSKAILAKAIYRIIKQKNLSQPKAAKLLGITQPALSRLLQGNLKGFSTDRLLRILNQLGQDINIKIKPIKPRNNRSIGITSVDDSSTTVIPMAAKSRQ